MQQLADEYGFNRRYGSRKARQGKWEKGKSSKIVAQRATKKVVESEANKEAELRKEYEKLINNTRRGAYQALVKEKDFDRLKHFKIFSEILSNCRKEQWEINEMQEVAKKIDNQISGDLNTNDPFKELTTEELREIIKGKG